MRGFLLVPVTLAAAFFPIVAAATPDTASTASTNSQATSAYSITGDDLQMNTLGSEYIHSRHTGLMPYWGPCYRCKKKMNITSLTSDIASSSPGNPWEIKGSGDQWQFIDPQAAQQGSGYTYVLSYDKSKQNFSGFVNLTGSSEIGYVCGGNSGLIGSGSSIFAMNSPVGVNNCDGSYIDTQTATGGPITLNSDGTFSGTAIDVNNYWGTYTFTPESYCIDATFNGTSIGDMCASGKIERTCKQYSPTSSECQTSASASQDDLPTYEWACDTSENGWNTTSVCSDTAIDDSGAEWLFGSEDGISGTAQAGYSVMQAEYENTTSSPISATLTFAADNYGWVWINGDQVGYTDTASAVSTDSVSLPSGTDTVDFMVMNDPNSPATDPTEYQNPAAGILALTNSAGQTLLATNDTDWTLVDTTPATPDPTPQSLLPSGYTPENCASGGC